MRLERRTHRTGNMKKMPHFCLVEMRERHMTDLEARERHLVRVRLRLRLRLRLRGSGSARVRVRLPGPSR